MHLASWVNDLYFALSPSISAFYPMVNKKKCIQQQRQYHAVKRAVLKAKMAEEVGKIAELDAELAIMEESKGKGSETMEYGSNKRLRT